MWDYVVSQTYRRPHLKICLSDVHLFSLFIKKNVIFTKNKKKKPKLPHIPCKSHVFKQK